MLAERAAALVRQRDAGRDLAATHALGRIELALATDSAAVDRAVALLRESADGDDTRMDYGLDYTAALLTRYAQRRGLQDLLEAVDRTSDLVGRDPRACWNHVVGLAWLAVREEGTAVRMRCTTRCETVGCAVPVVRDDGPSFTADKRALALSGRFPEAAWDYVWLDALPRWGRAVRAGDTAAMRQSLDDARAVALMQAARRRDSTAIVAVNQIAATSDGAARVRRARAHELFAEARGSQNAGPRSPGALLDSVEALSASTDAIRVWVALQRANTLLTSGRPATALSAYERIDRAPDTASVLGSRLVLNQAIATMAAGETLEALRRFELLAAGCERAGRVDCAQYAAGMAASLATRLGASEQLDVAHRRLLAAATNAPNTWRWTTLSVQRQYAEQVDLTRVGELLRREAAHVARLLGRSNFEVEDLVIGARDRLARGDTSDVRTHLARIRTLMPTLADEDRRFHVADVWRLEGELRLRARQPGAQAYLDSAIAAMRPDSNRVRQLQPRLPHALAVLEGGDTARALGELDSLISAIADDGVGRASVFERASLDRLSRSAGIVASRILRDRGESIGALLSLSGESYRRRSSPVPSDSLLLSLAFRRDGDTVLVWVRHRERWSVQRVWYPSDSVRIGSQSMQAPALRALHARLLAPALLFAARPVGTLRIDARDDLAAVPWAALVDGNGHYVAERSAVVLTNSILEASTRRRSASRGRVVLVNAAPTQGDRALLGAAGEIDALKEMWGARASVTPGASFDVSRFGGTSSPVSVLHFAGHAVLDARRPTQSYLELGDEAGRVLRADDLRAAALQRVDLIVLAACESRGTAADALGAFESLAGVLRAAGAGAVIGASRSIDDAGTRLVMVALHQALRDGLTPERALQRAQQLAIRSADPDLRAPATWAAFQLLGS